MEIIDRFISVLACRFSPRQKSDIVNIVREHKPSSVTLAVGDGANDVNMIITAHVGVGITGKEGAQAARASDFSIQQFKNLKRLIFAHGREAYRRNTQLIYYIFWKDMILAMPNFWYGFYQGFSGNTIFYPILLVFINLVYSGIGIFVYAIFDQEYTYSKLANYPHKYYFRKWMK